MNIQLITQTPKNYISHIMIGEQKIIPSDTFELGENEYILLNILHSTEGEHYLRIMGIVGDDTGSIYTIPKKEFESNNLKEMNMLLADYKNTI